MTWAFAYVPLLPRVRQRRNRPLERSFDTYLAFRRARFCNGVPVVLSMRIWRCGSFGSASPAFQTSFFCPCTMVGDAYDWGSLPRSVTKALRREAKFTAGLRRPLTFRGGRYPRGRSQTKSNQTKARRLSPASLARWHACGNLNCRPGAHGGTGRRSGMHVAVRTGGLAYARQARIVDLACVRRSTAARPSAWRARGGRTGGLARTAARAVDLACAWWRVAARAGGLAHMRQMRRGRRASLGVR